MASTTPHKIMLQTNEEATARPVFEDLLASVALTPGEILAVSSGALIPHGSANGAAKPLRVAEKSDTISDPTAVAIDHDYEAGEGVNYLMPQPGDLCYIFVKASEVMVKGVTLLSSDGAGALQAIVPDATTVTGTVVAQAEEDKTVGGTRERVKVRIL